MSSFGGRALPKSGGGSLQRLGGAGAVLLYNHRVHRNGGGGGGQSIAEMIHQGQIAYELNEQAQQHKERTATFLNSMSRNSDGFHDHTFMAENSPTIKDATNATIKVTKAAAGIAKRMDDPPDKPTPGTPEPFSPTPFRVKASAPGMKRTSKNPNPPTQGNLS